MRARYLIAAAAFLLTPQLGHASESWVSGMGESVQEARDDANQNAQSSAFARRTCVTRYAAPQTCRQDPSGLWECQAAVSLSGAGCGGGAATAQAPAQSPVITQRQPTDDNDVDPLGQIDRAAGAAEQVGGLIEMFSGF